MATTLDEPVLISEVRELTDYPASVLDDAGVQTLISTAKKDIKAETENYDINWYNPDDVDGNRALFWTTCLYAKIKAGELDAADMSIADLDIEALIAAGKQHGQRPVMWYENAHKYIDKLRLPGQNAFPFGHRSVERSNREYHTDGFDA